VLFNLLNDVFVAGLIGLVPAHYHCHILFSMRMPGLPLLYAFGRCNSWKLIFRKALQCS